MPQETPTDKYAQGTNPVKPNGFDKYVQQPLTREQARGLFQQGAFQGDSKYDKGLVYGVEQMPLRARNQPWYDQVGNNAAKLVPAIALGITENAGYIGELFSNDQDYTNALTEFATRNRQNLENALPTYRENPNEVFDWKDSGWWAQHGMGLAESIGEFFVTGAGVGGALGKGAQLLNYGLRSGKYTSAGINALAQLGTAATLSYTEGAMAGAQVYQDVYNAEMEKHLNAELANQKASEAAAHTVKLNTLINTGLNLSSVTPLFKTFDNLYTTSRLGLNRGAGEKLAAWSARLDELEKAGVQQASLKGALVREALQEGLEEDVNLFAESEGRIKGGVKQATSSSVFGRFMDNVFSEEGALNFLLGAVGGVGQTAGMELIPYRSVTNEDGTTRRMNNRSLAELQQNEEAGRLITTLRDDINYLTAKQKELDDAVAANDPVRVLKAKNDLFNVAALKSIRSGAALEFQEDIRSIANIDNVTIGEDGKTEAMRQGFANDPTDNEYKEVATKKAADIKLLADEYQDIAARFQDKFVADSVFRERLNVYSAQDTVTQLARKNELKSAEVAKILTNNEVTEIINDLGLQEAVERSANISALNGLINGLEETPGLDAEGKKMLASFKNSAMVEQKVLSDILESTPSLKALLETNKGAVLELSIARSPYIASKAILDQAKVRYNKLLANQKETTDMFNKERQRLQDLAKQVQEEEKKAKEKDKEEADLKTAQEAKKQIYKEQVGNFLVRSSATGGFDVVDEEAGIAISNHPSVEAAKAAAQEATKKAKKETVRTEPAGNVVTPEPTPVVVKPAQPEPYQGKTKEADKKQEEELDTQVTQKNINEEKVSKANKIAYRAKESDNSPINPDYLLLHSSTVGIGQEVVLKVATETKFYKEGMPIAKQPIGVYINDKLSGYVHLTSEDKPDPAIYAIREAVVNRGPITTKIVDKDFGVMNRSDRKHTTAEAMPVVEAMVINVDGVFMSGVKKPFEGISNKPVDGTNGHTYAVVKTPNGKLFAIPLDTKRINKETAESIMTAFQIFMRPEDLTPQENKLMDEVFEKYDIDIRTAKGFEKYFKALLFNYNLGDPVDVAEKNAREDDHRWINFTGNGLRYLKTKGAVTVNGKVQAKEIGKNTPPEIYEVALEEMLDHISKMYYDINIERLQDNRPVNLPIFGADESGLTVKAYTQPSYVDHIKAVTETNVVGTFVQEGEYTYFINPRLYFDTAFVGATKEESYGKPAVIAPSPEKKKLFDTSRKDIPPLKSKTKRLPKQTGDTSFSLSDYEDVVNYSLRVSTALRSDKVREPGKSVEGFYNDLRKQGVPKQQLELIEKVNPVGKTKQEILNELLSQYNFGIVIAKGVPTSSLVIEYEDKNEWAVYNHLTSAHVKTFKTKKEAKQFLKDNKDKLVPTKDDKSFTVPGGKKYKERAINIPGTSNLVHGHGAVSSPTSIGWFRADEVDKETQRVLEIQSDLFQKGRETGRYSNEENTNTFLNLLADKGNWIDFFSRLVIQDAVNNKYKKVRFPTGATAVKIQRAEEAPLIKNITAFYDERVKSALDKIRGNFWVTTVTDDYDNTWYELQTWSEETLSLSPAEATENLFSDVIIPGFTPYTQQEVVNHLTEQVLLDVAEDEQREEGKGRRSFNEYFSKYIDWAEGQIEAGNELYEPIIENIDRFRVLVKDKLDRIGLLKGIPLDQQGINIEGDSVSDGYYWEDDWVFKFDTKSNAQKQIKEFLLFIPKTEFSNGEYSEVLNYLGTVSYMAYDEVFEELKAILSDVPNTWDAMKRELQEYQENKPWIYNLLFQMENFEGDKEQLTHQFVTTFSSTYSASKTLIWDGENGVYNFKVIDTDQNAAGKTLLNRWKTNFNTGGFYTEDGDGVAINKEKVAEAIATIKELKENPKGVKAFLDSVGIEVSNETVTALLEGKVGGLKYETHFTSNRGVFKLIEDRLSGKDAAGLELDEVINPVINNSAIRSLAAAEVRNNPHVYSNSYINGEGNTVYSYSLGKFITKQFDRLLPKPVDGKRDKTYINSLMELTFQAPIMDGNVPMYKTWLHNLQNNDEFANYFSIAPFDTIKQANSNYGVRLSNMADIDLELSKWTLFQNRGQAVKGVGRVANYLFTIPAKTTSYVITANAIDPNLSSSGALGKEVRDALYSVALTELKRINSVANKKITLNRYKAGSKYFYFFPSLNAMEAIWNSDGTVKLPTTKVTTPDGEFTVERLIRNEVERVVQAEIASKINYWNDIGFVKDGQLQYVDKFYAGNIKGDNAFKIRVAAADYVINSILAEFNMHQVFIGDPAIYYKGNVAKTWDEIGKRLAAMIAPGRDLSLNTTDEKFISIKVKDKEDGNIALNLAQLKQRLGDLAKPYENINGTDAQEFTTVKEHLFVLHRSGLIDSETYRNITEKAERFGDNLVLTQKELGVVLQPLKPVYVETEINNSEDVMALEYVKSSSIPLLPQFTKGLELDEIRKGMQKLEDKKGYPVRLAFDSATKVGGIASTSIWDDKGELMKNLNFDKYHKILPRTGFRIQQDVPYDPNYDEVVKATQVTKLLFDSVLKENGFEYNGETMTGAKLQEVWTKLHEKLFKDAHAELDKDILVNGQLNIKKVQELLLKEATIRAYSPADVAALSLLPDNTFEFPFWAITASKKYESILTSLYTNNIIKQKMHGTSLILVSEEAVKGKSAGVVYTESYDPKTGLQPMRVDEKGKVLPAQVLIPWKFKADIQNYVKDGVIDTTKLPKELLNQFAFRIPNQGHNSMSLIEVVGFLPEVMGDAVIASRNFIVQMGSDFDIDKLYIYDYYTKEVDGKLIRDDEGSKGTKNSLLDIHKAVLNNEKVYNSVVTPLGNVKDSESAKYLKSVYSTTPNTYLSPDYKKAKYLESVDGKSMVGLESLASTLNSLLQGLNIYTTNAKGERDYFVIGNEKGKRVALYDLSDPYNWKGETKNSVIAADQSGAVDNEKDPILSYINSNPVVAPVRAFLRQVGVDGDWINYFCSQGVIREVVDTIRKSKSSVGVYTRNIDEVTLIAAIEKATQAYLDTLSPSEANVFNINNLLDEPITADALKAAIKSPTPRTNLVALLKFEQALNWGRSLQSIQSSINIESKGIGKSVLEVSVKADNVMRLTAIKNLANVTKLVGEYTEKGIVPGTYTGHIITEGLLPADKVLGSPTNELFKYNSRSFKTALSEFELIYGTPPTVDQAVEIWENMKSYLYAGKVNANRKDLFIGKDSLAKRVKALMRTNKDAAVNPFLVRLNFEFGTTNKKPDFLFYNAAKEEFVDEINVYQGLISLIDSSDENVAKIGEDLVSYFYINGGLQKAREWGKYIHPAYLKRYQGGSFLSALKNIDFQDLSTIGGNALISDFMLQYFQHKPYLVPGPSPEAFKKLKVRGNEVTLPDPLKADDIIIPLRDDEARQYVPIFSVVDKDAAKGRQLWIYDRTLNSGEIVYKRINVLGTTNFVEYSRDSRAESLVNANYKTKVASVAPIKNHPKPDIKSVPTESYDYLTGSAEEVVKRLKSSNPIVKVLKDANLKGYQIYQNNKLDKAGVIHYDAKRPGWGYIEFNPNNTRNVENTIIHELIHAVTVKAVDSIDGLTPAQQKAVTSIKTIVNTLRTRALNGEFEQAGWKASELKEFEDLLNRKSSLSPTELARARALRPKYYGITSSNKSENVIYKEFLAELFSSPEFQQILNNIKYDSRKTLLERFIELIESILKGFAANVDSAFETALKEAIILIVDKPTSVAPATPKKNLFDINRKDAPPKGSYSFSLGDTVGEDYDKLLDQFKARIKFIDESISKAIIAKDDLRAQQLINRKEEVNKELAEFEEKQIFASITVLAEKDLNQVEAIFNRGGVSHNDINYTRRVIQTWLESPELVLTDTDKADANQRAKDIYKIVGRATELSKRWEAIARTAVLNAVKEESGMANLTQEALNAQNSINALTANMLDISRSGNILLSVMDKWMRESIYRANLEAKEVHDKTIKLSEALNKSDAFKKDGYYIFAQTDKNGELTGELVQPLVADYYKDRNELIENATTATTKAGKKDAWQKYFAWVRDNHTFFDVRKLFRQENDGTYTYDPDKDYLSTLKKQFDNFDELLTEQKKKIQNYNERLKLKEQSLEGNPEINKEMEKWKVQYDPSIYLRNTLSNEYSAQVVNGQFIKNEGHEFVVKRANKKWMDEKYNKIQNSPELSAFYNHFVKTLNDLYRFIPPSYKDGVNTSTIPGIVKSVLETYNEEGMNAAATTANNDLIAAISSTEEEIEFSKLKIPVENKTLSVRYLKNLSPEEKSYDLGKVLNMFASEALLYKHKSTVEDSIKLAYSIIEQGYNTLKEPEKIGMIKRFGEITKGKSAKDMMDQVEYAIDAFYGNRKKVQGATRKKVYTNKAKKKVDTLLKELEAGTVLTPESQKFYQELQDEYGYLMVINSKGESQFDVKTAAARHLASNTRYVVGSKVGDVLLQYMQLKGMGWNIFGSVTNVVFGWFSNFVHAGGGTDFTTSNLLKANRIMLSSTQRGVGIDNPTARKINSLMVKYDILKELNDASYRATTNTNRVKRGIENIAPFELQRRGEYFVQGMTMIASMLNTKVTVNGESTNLWDAYDEYGEFKDKTNKDWNVDLSDRASGKEQFKLKFKLDQLNKSIHGNYDPSSPVRIKQGILGRAAMQFRSWIAEGVANRLEGRKYDLLLGRERKGRWRTYTDLGFKDSFRVLLRLARGKSIEGIVSEFDKDIVVMNMKRNLTEIYQSLTLLALYMIITGIDTDDDDWKKSARNFTINQILRLQDDIEFYYSPLAVENITQNFVPVFTLIRDASKFGDALEKGIIEGEWEYKSGKKAGENRILWTGAKIFPFGSSIASFINKTENEEGFRK